MTALTASRPLASHRDTLRQLVSFGAIGVASTVAYVALYSWLRETMPAGGANALALVITAVGNTSANRLLTFRVRGREGWPATMPPGSWRWAPRSRSPRCRSSC